MQLRLDRDNPWYWHDGDRPCLLLGGSVEDNLFQVENVERELDLLLANGGNYLRCTLSSRDSGNLWPFHQGPDGRYDLERWNGAYWQRLERFLTLTAERGIAVQIELWDRFDQVREPWRANPWNPDCNRTYDPKAARLATDYPNHPSTCESGFFHSVPPLSHNPCLLGYQRAFIDHLLDRSLAHTHLLYCIDNETNDRPEWGWFWARHLRDRAKAAGLDIHITEMWDQPDLDAPAHSHTADHPECYNFLEWSQNTLKQGAAVYRNFRQARCTLAARDRRCPINTVKVYGRDGGHHGTTAEAEERFWMQLLAGAAAVRFHRPPAGLGLGALACKHLRTARAFTNDLPPWECTAFDRYLDDGVLGWEHPDGRLGLWFRDGTACDMEDRNDRAVTWRHAPSGSTINGRMAGCRIRPPDDDTCWTAVIEAP